MSRYFTNVSNNIKERVNEAHIDNLFTKDAEGEFRKVVAGESGGVDIELPNYLKPETIEFNTTETGVTPNIISKSNVRSSLISANAIRMSGSINPMNAINYSSQTSGEFRITGGNAGLNYTSYTNKEILSRQYGDVPSKKLILEDIMDAQANYLKPDKIEFSNETGLSADGLSYKEGSSIITKTIKDIINSSGGGGISDLGKFQASNDNKTLTSENIEASLLKMRTITAPAGAINTVAMLPYLKPDSINFVKNQSNMSPAIQIRQIGNSNGLILDTGGIISENQLLGSLNTIAPDGLGIADYSLDDAIILKAKDFTAKHAGSYHVTALNKDIVDVTNKFKDVTETVTNINNVVSKFKDVTETATNINNVVSKFKLVTGAVANINNIVSKFATAAGTPSLTSAVIRDALVKVNDLTVTATQINDVVSAGIGTTYPYLKSDHLEFNNPGTVAKSIFVKSPGRNMRIDSGSVVVAYGDDVEGQTNLTRITDSGLAIYGSLSNRYTHYAKDYIRFMDTTGTYEADLKTIIQRSSPGYYYHSNWANRSSAQTFWVYKLVPNMVTTHSFFLTSILRFKQKAVSRRKEFCFRMEYVLQSPLTKGADFSITFRADKGSHIDPFKQAALFEAHTPGGLFEVISVGESEEGDDDANGPGDVWTSYTGSHLAYLYYTIKCKAVRNISATTILFNLYLKFHGYIGDYVDMDTSLIGN